MSDRLPRHIPAPGQRHRYGTWDLASDREPGAPLGSEPGPAPEWTKEHEEQVRILTRRQRRLSVATALVLFGTVFSVIVAGYILPDEMTRVVWNGFSPSFLFAAVLVYPLAWLLAVAYTWVANRMDGLR